MLKEECEKFETALQYKLKLCFSGVEAGVPSRLFFKFGSGTHELFKSWVNMLRGVGVRNVLIVWLVRSL